MCLPVYTFAKELRFFKVFLCIKLEFVNLMLIHVDLGNVFVM